MLFLIRISKENFSIKRSENRGGLGENRAQLAAKNESWKGIKKKQIFKKTRNVQQASITYHSNTEYIKIFIIFINGSQWHANKYEHKHTYRYTYIDTQTSTCRHPTTHIYHNFQNISKKKCWKNFFPAIILFRHRLKARIIKLIT